MSSPSRECALPADLDSNFSNRSLLGARAQRSRRREIVILAWYLRRSLKRLRAEIHATVGTNELHERLTQVFRDVFADDALMLEPDTSASQVPGWDSLAHLRLMLTIEKTFRVKFTATEIGQLKNVGDLEKLLASKS